MIEITINVIEKNEKPLQFEKTTFMLYIKFGAGLTEYMRLLAAPAPQH
jgi:hypothetical protein